VSRLHITLALAAALAATQAAAGAFVDVLDTPAQPSPLAARSLLQGIAQAGNRLVAVGQRGHVLVSRDDGKAWTQSPVPVSSDLTAIYFVDADRGWAVGHDGVILHTDDGGTRWNVQLTGRQANDLFLQAMERRVAAEPASAAARAALEEAKRFREQGADKPFLYVWFADSAHGFAVGAYNMIFATSDGGRTWEPWFDRTENPKLLNLYAIRPAAGEVYIAGEGGLVMRLDPAAQRFRAVALPYKGSLFGVAGANNAVLVYGLRGNAFRSGDAGRTWNKVDAGLPASIVAAAPTRHGALMLADAGGRVAVSEDGGVTFRPVPIQPAVPLTAVATASDGRVIAVGPRGATRTDSVPD